MTEEEKRKMIEDLRKDDDEAETENVWTADAVLEAGKRIMKRMGFDEKMLQ